MFCNQSRRMSRLPAPLAAILNVSVACHRPRADARRPIPAPTSERCGIAHFARQTLGPALRLPNLVRQTLLPRRIENRLQGFVDLDRGAVLCLVDGVLLAVDEVLLPVHFILFGVHGPLLSVDLRL